MSARTRLQVSMFIGYDLRRPTS